MAYDILIKGGSVIDGNGTPPAVTDIGIKGDKITHIGALEEKETQVVIQASGKYVTPGFIDLTNSSDTSLTIFKYPQLESLLKQGITTIIGGNCGSSLAPLGSKSALKSIRKWADTSEINADWNTMEEFLARVEKMRLGVNFGTFVGYGTLRRSVVGDEIKTLTQEEKEKIKYLLREGIEAGAFGFSLGLSYGHERVSSTEELIEIVKTLSETGGIVKIHLRSEGMSILASVNEAIRIGRETKAPIQISHLKAVGRQAWPHFKKVLELIKTARDSGVDINFDVSPYSTTGSLLYLLIPTWARQGGFDELFKKLKQPEERRKIIEHLKTYTLHYDKIIINSAKLNSLVGKTLKEIADSSGLEPEEALLETVYTNEGRVKIIGRTVSVKNTKLAIKDENSFICSDGAGYGEEEIKSGSLVHPRSFGAFPHFWHHFVKNLYTLSPEEAVQKITSGPARKLKLWGRGAITLGNYADLVIFDPEKIRDRATYKSPYQYAEGIEYLIINGQLAIKDNLVTNARAGRTLRHKL